MDIGEKKGKIRVLSLEDIMNHPDNLVDQIKAAEKEGRKKKIRTRKQNDKKGKITWDSTSRQYFN